MIICIIHIFNKCIFVSSKLVFTSDHIPAFTPIRPYTFAIYSSCYSHQTIHSHQTIYSSCYSLQTIHFYHILKLLLPSDHTRLPYTQAATPTRPYTFTIYSSCYSHQTIHFYHILKFLLPSDHKLVAHNGWVTCMK